MFSLINSNPLFPGIITSKTIRSNLIIAILLAAGDTAGETTTYYFDTIEDRVLNKVKAPKAVFSIKIFTTYIAPIAIAASLLLIFILNTNQKTITFDSLATSEIEQFIDNGFVDINSESLALAFSSVEIPTNIMSATISEEEVLDYLYTEDLEAIIYEN